MIPPTHPVADVFPLIEGDAFDELVDDIRRNGLVEPVWLYDDPTRGTVLIDGRNRWRACEVADVKVRTRHYRGEDPIGFSVALNVARRHLNAGQRAFVAVELVPLYAAEAKLRKRGPSQFASADRHTQKPDRAADRAAKRTGASGRTVARALHVAGVAPDLADKVREGSLALDRAERIVRDRAAETRKVDEARAQAAAQPVPTTVDIRLGDFRDVLADVTDIDAVITDPPYPAEYLPLLADLAAWADKVLNPEGVLAVLIGQSYLPEVFRLLDGHRPYRWTCCYLTDGPGYVAHHRRVQSNWKPLLVYGRGPRIADVVRSAGSTVAKDRHHWGQDYAAFHAIVDMLTVPGATVADPFMGSGTTLLAGHALGRNVIGSDLDPVAVATAQERLT